MASEVSPNWLLSVPSCTSLVAGRQGCPCFFLSFFAAMAFTPSDTGGHKTPGLWLLAKRPGLLARPFSDLFNVAASRPAKSPRGGLMSLEGPRVKPPRPVPPLVNPGHNLFNNSHPHFRTSLSTQII